jgi:hypothetical protein
VTTFLNDSQLTEKQVFELVNTVTDSKTVSCERLGGGLNSRVYKATVEDTSVFVVKFYFSSTADHRDRLGNEFTSLSFLWEQGFRNIPQPMTLHREASCAIYQYCEGSNITADDVTKEDVKAVVTFFASLKSLKQEIPLPDFLSASEAFFSVKGVINNIQSRLERLFDVAGEKGVSDNLNLYLNNDFVPFFKTLIAWCSQKAEENGVLWEEEIPEEERILSPSDFGFHNALRVRNGNLVFFDFEYFGWDDPSKTISDFLLHPADSMQINSQLKQRFYTQFCSALNSSIDLDNRVEVLFPLFGLKWCLIFLNEFIPSEYKRRIFASQSTENIEQCKLGQLLKAKDKLDFIKTTYKNFPYR